MTLNLSQEAEYILDVARAAGTRCEVGGIAQAVRLAAKNAHEQYKKDSSDSEALDKVIHNMSEIVALYAAQYQPALRKLDVL